MPKEVLYGIIGLLIGVLITVFVASTAVNNGNIGMMSMMGMNTERMEKKKNKQRMMMNYKI